MNEIGVLVAAIAVVAVGCGGERPRSPTTTASVEARVQPPAPSQTPLGPPSASGSGVPVIAPTPIPSVVVVMGPNESRGCVRDSDCALATDANCCGECAVFPFVALSTKVIEARHEESTKHCPEEDWDCSKVACDPVPTGCRAVPACIRGLCEAQPVGACAR